VAKDTIVKECPEPPSRTKLKKKKLAPKEAPLVTSALNVPPPKKLKKKRKPVVVQAPLASGPPPEVKRLEKQLRQISTLQASVSAGLTLSAEEVTKLAKRSQVEAALSDLHAKLVAISVDSPEATANATQSTDACRAPGLTSPEQKEGRKETNEGRKERRKVLKKRKADAVTQPVVEEMKRQRNVDGKAVVPVISDGDFRKKHEIIVTGTCPAAFQTFDAAEGQLGESITAALCSQGYTAPTPIQAMAWPLALRGQDMIGVAKTGSGKTCGFLLPILVRLRQRGPSTPPGWNEPALPSVLVLAPTRELAQQIAGEAEKFAVVALAKVATLYGGVPKRDQMFELEAGPDIVIATPGRLMDFSKGVPERGLSAKVALNKVTYLVLDEADRMLDMGFERDIRTIVAQCPESGRPEQSGAAVCSATARQTLFFTATWPKEVQRTAASMTSNAVQLCIGQGAGGDKLTANKNVTQTVKVVDERSKLEELKEVLLKELGPGETAFVFAKTRHTCDYLEQQLWDEKEELSIGTWCRAIHSHKVQWERDASLATFRNMTVGTDNGRRAVLVATDVAARGLDIPGVALVVVYDFGGGNLGEDSGVESYVHRIGRTGRAEKTGRAITFFTKADKGATKLISLLKDANQKVSDELRSLADRDSGRRGGGSSSGKGGKAGGKGGKGKGNGKGGKGKGGKGRRY